MGPLALKRDELFTYGDYLTWDDSERWELIDGVPYNMTPAPRRIHQLILADLIRQFTIYLHLKPCQVYPAPFDVRLPEAGESDHLVDTVVQPDLSVICDRKKLDDAGCRGAPDLIVEILSPGTANKDLKVKFAKYERAGVREYWIIDPLKKSLQVNRLGHDGSYGQTEIFSHLDRPRVGIFPDLKIDLEALFTD